MKLTPEVEHYLDGYPMTVEEANEPPPFSACACVGTPFRPGLNDDGSAKPCYCELRWMKRQRVLGEPVVGWAR